MTFISLNSQLEGQNDIKLKLYQCFNEQINIIIINDDMIKFYSSQLAYNTKNNDYLKDLNAGFK